MQRSREGFVSYESKEDPEEIESHTHGAGAEPAAGLYLGFAGFSILLEIQVAWHSAIPIGPLPGEHMS